MFAESKKLFALPLTEKVALSDSTLSRGYTALREETLDLSNQTTGDTKEGFSISIHDVSKLDTVRYNPDKLTGPNQWPNPTQSPSFVDPLLFRKVSQTYMKEALDVARQLIQFIAESLELKPCHFDDAFVEPIAVLRLLHYEPTPSKVEDGIFGCGAHSDYGMLTLLATDDHPGLQIWHDGTWIHVPPRRNAYVVNLGDMLERWTNGKYKSTVHRVVNDAGHERYSMPFFVEPHFDTVVTCLPSCCHHPDNPPKYPPTTSGEHLKEKYRQTHADYKPPPPSSSS